jgi:hypothetical protein
MPLPPLIQKKYSDRFQELIKEGEAIKSSIRIESGGYLSSPYDPVFVSQEPMKLPDKTVMDWARLTKWRTNCISFLKYVVPTPGPHDSALNVFQKDMSPHQLDSAISILKGFKEDFERGFLEDISAAIEAEIAADYMGQAESLLIEGQMGKYDYVPAAALAGAVLEKSLRTLCGRQQPPVLEINAKGEPKTLNPLIDDLKKAGVFNELKAKQLRSWADIRNKAAHGEFDAFTKQDVEQMLHGINNFLADYLK